MTWSWLLIISLLVFIVVKYRKFSKRSAPLPPGPPADPLIGHIRSIPPSGQDVHFYELGLKYGDVVYQNIMGQPMVILNSVRAATELLDKRGAIYSDRPTFPIYELMGMAQTLPFLKYGTEWRKQRTILHQHFNTEKSKEYLPIQAREARTLSQKLLTTTEDRLKLLLHFSTAIIIEVNYGHQIQSSEDPYFKIASECSRATAESGPPGGTPIDLFPFLRHFPSWVPGTYYARYARNSFPKFLMLFQHPYNQIKEQMAKGTVKPSVLASALEDLHRTGDESEADIKRIQAATAVSYIAGAETTSSTLSFFLLAMVLHPEFQKKAQEEIDRVVGAGRLPEFQDRENLPFVECIVQETMRWYQPVPAGVPHKSMEDDIYNGMLIPKGSVVVANVRAMTLDSATYKDPFKFDPTRYLAYPEGRGEPHPVGHFGFGRRICPGRHLGEQSVWIAIATILATSVISRAVGKDGKEVIPEASVVATGIASHASPFPCELNPRNAETLNLLQRLIDSS